MLVVSPAIQYMRKRRGEKGMSKGKTVNMLTTLCFDVDALRHNERFFQMTTGPFRNAACRLR
jgi:hypothetical protein